eukprot:GSA120T00007694001.1
MPTGGSGVAFFYRVYKLNGPSLLTGANRVPAGLVPLAEADVRRLMATQSSTFTDPFSGNICTATNPLRRPYNDVVPVDLFSSKQYCAVTGAAASTNKPWWQVEFSDGRPRLLAGFLWFRHFTNLDAEFSETADAMKN